MRPNKTMPARRPFRASCAALLALSSLAGCNDYLERRDTVTLGVGDAIAVNKATQTINRWPDAARQDRWLSDGERARTAASRYRNRTVAAPAALDSKPVEAESSLDKAPAATNGK